MRKSNLRKSGTLRANRQDISDHGPNEKRDYRRVSKFVSSGGLNSTYGSFKPKDRVQIDYLRKEELSPQQKLMEEYTNLNSNFKNGIKILEKSIEDPVTREQYIKQANDQKIVQKIKSSKSVDSDSVENKSDTSSMKAAHKEKVKKCDLVYGIMDTYKKRFEVKNKTEKHS